MSKTKNKVKQVKTKSLPARINKVRDLIESADNTIGSVEFTKRGDGKARKMAYRLHVKPEHVRKTGEGYRAKEDWSGVSQRIRQKRLTDLKNLQVTVYDTNVREAGKSSYRVIPLENVSKIRVKGVTYEIL
jgi:hypothetical protein